MGRVAGRLRRSRRLTLKPLAWRSATGTSTASSLKIFRSGWFSPSADFLALSPEASESTAYLHSDYLDGNVSDQCESSYKSASSCFKPLVTAANVPAGTHFGETVEGECKTFRCGPQFAGASPDAKHVVLESPAQLTETPTEGQVPSTSGMRAVWCW